MKKKIISLLLAIVMIVGMLPLSAITAFAEEAVTEYYALDIGQGAYIDTNFFPSSTTRVVMDAETATAGNMANLFGVYREDSYFYVNNSLGSFGGSYGSVEPRWVAPFASGRHKIELDRNNFKFDGTVKDTFSSPDFQCSDPMYLFALNFYGDVQFQGGQRICFYGCQIYNNGNMAFDFVPAGKNDKYGLKYGLFDKLTGDFYEFKGSGSVSPVNGPYHKTALPTTPGSVLTSGTYVVSENTHITGNEGQSALIVSGFVTIIIENDVELVVHGGSAIGKLGAGAGIEVPAGSALTVAGSGYLSADGGMAAYGENGHDGKDGIYYYEEDGNNPQFDDDDWGYPGAGGNGGAGGGGAGAGIGGRGGNGGAGGKGADGVDMYLQADTYKSGLDGEDGQAGTAGGSCGNVSLYDSLWSPYIRGGYNADGPFDAPCSDGGAVGDTSIFDGFYDYPIFGGGGGGAGGNGYTGAGIGTGGSGGGGGGGGGSGCMANFFEAKAAAARGNGYGGKGGVGYNGTGGEGSHGDDYNLDIKIYPGEGGAGGGGGTVGIEKAPCILATHDLPAPRTDLVYNGNEQEGVSFPFGNTTVNKATNAGEYTATLTPYEGYYWKDGTYGERTVTWSIAKCLVPLPKEASYCYTDEKITFLTETDIYTVENGSATEIGDYTVKLKLKDADNYKWENSDDETVSLHFSIHAFKDDGSGKCEYCGGAIHYVYDVDYLDRVLNGNNTVRTEEKTCIVSKQISPNDAVWGVAGETSWYTVDSDITMAGRPTVKGNVNIILQDGTTLTANKGITVEEGNTLNVYGQKDDSGKLIATGAGGGAGIGGGKGAKGGTVTVYGGTVSAKGSTIGFDDGGAGIGGGRNGNGGTVTVYGGTVNANGGRYAAGIGGGDGYNGGGAKGGTVTIYGGTVNATGGNRGAGIGGGRYGNGGTVTVYGGSVSANGGDVGAGIGGGTYGDGGTVTVNGGIVNANGGTYGAGIGGGGGGAGGTVTVWGGTVTATGGNAAGIGKGSDVDGIASDNDGRFEFGSSVAFIKAGPSAQDAETVTEYRGQSYLFMHFHSIWEPIDDTYHKCDYCGKTELHVVKNGICVDCGRIKDKYIVRNWNEQSKKVDETEKDIPEDIAVIITEKTTGFAGGWYVLTSDVVLDGRISVTGTPENPTNIILMDGRTLTVTGGIEVAKGNVLNIYGQKNNSGKIIATAGNNAAGIGGGDGIDGGTVTVYGGTVNATGGYNGAGIGGGWGVTGGTVTVWGGIVTANGDGYSAGIGGGIYGDGGTVTVWGGTVNATGGISGGAGIGGGSGTVTGSTGRIGGDGGTVTVNGGTVNATGGNNAAGIGGGLDADGGTITVNGGTVNATGGNRGAGIGGGYRGIGGNVKIYGGIVNATGGDNAVGIGGVAAISWGVIHGTVAIYGGIVTAIGGSNAAGISTEDSLTLGGFAIVKAGTGEDNAPDTSYTGQHYVYIHCHNFIGGKCTDCGERGTYIVRSWNETAAKVSETEKDLPDGAIMITARTTELAGGWYILASDVVFNERISVTGTPENPTNIILVDGYTLNAEKGGIKVAEGNALNIYGQKDDSGKIIATGGDNAAGIGSGGTVMIYGGIVTATGGTNAAGICGSGGTVAFYGGIVTAIGNGDVAGIGGSLTVVDDAAIKAGTGEDNAPYTSYSGQRYVNIHCHNFIRGKCTVCGKIDDRYKYIARNWNEQSKKVDETEEDITEEIAEITNGTDKLSGGWYVLASDVVFDGRITVTGTPENPTNIILMDGCTLTANGGIYVVAGYALNIYGQKGDSGKIIATGGNFAAGIGGAAIGIGTVAVAGNVTIYGGTVNANGGNSGAGIGGGNNGGGGTVTICGGTVTATGGDDAAGIGGGFMGNGGTVTVYSGTVNATGNGGAGIGSGGDNAAGIGGGTVTVWGGIVTATGNDGGAGIGGGNNGNGGTVTVNGGSVSANGGDNAAGIGGGNGGGRYGNGGNGGTVTVNGGSVSANGGDNAAGIGGGGGDNNGGNGGAVTVNGGSVSANGGDKAVGIGGGIGGGRYGNGGNGGTVAIYSGSVTATGGGDAAGIDGSLTLGDFAIVKVGTDKDSAYYHSYTGQEYVQIHFHNAEIFRSISGTQHKCLVCDETENHTDDGNGVCTVCGGKVIVAIPEKAAKCEEPGYHAYYQCGTKYYIDKDCTQEIDNIDNWKETDGRIEATGHSGEWKITTAATCTKEGSESLVCKVCGETLETKTIQATGHSGEWTVLSAATCTTDGKEIQRCKDCGEVIASKVIPAPGHRFSEDWSHNGSYHWHAAVCCDTEEVLDKEKHTYNFFGFGNTCTVCGYKKGDAVTGSVLSNGSWWIIGGIAVVAAIGVATLVIVKKKKKPALAGGENTDEE